MSEYRLLDTGKRVTEHHPDRGVWYAADGKCGYWTDDWSALKLSGPIPCCPHCGCPGMQITWSKWIHGAEVFEKHDPPNSDGYTKFLMETKGICGANTKKSFMERFEEWRKNQQQTCT